MQAEYAKAVAQTWRRHSTSTFAAEPLELVRYACLAASSHNTQPWRFELDHDAIRILPDYSRRCPAVDPDDHHLYASLGCAAENLVVAARAGGRSAIVRDDAASTGVRVELHERTPAEPQRLDAILSRQCTRTPYDGRPLTAHERRTLDAVTGDDGVSVLLLTEDRWKSEIADYVAEGNRAQFADAAWAAELQSWIRFNAKDAIRTGDGLYGPVMGDPDVPPWFGRLYMKVALSAEAQNRRDSRCIESSSAIAVIHCAANDPRHWIAAGRCYERLALQAAALDLRTAFINQPVEVPRLRSQFASYLGIGDRRPDLVVRIGHAPLAPKSLRRPLGDVVVTRVAA